MKFISVFNDVLGPVMRGPSSSHTAGAYRIGRMVRDLLAEDPRRSGRRFTLVVPSNAAWEKAMMDFSKAYNTIVEGQFPQYVSCQMMIHYSPRFDVLRLSEPGDRAASHADGRAADDVRGAGGDDDEEPAADSGHGRGGARLHGARGIQLAQ